MLKDLFTQITEHSEIVSPQVADSYVAAHYSTIDPHCVKALCVRMSVFRAYV